MAKVKLYNQEGKVVGDVELTPSIFEVEVSEHVVHEAVVAQLGNRRQVLAHTKTRGEVRGGGRKPWKQKGTGRARHGSRRSPIWVGGGITFGPRKNRNFSKKINKKVRRQAICMVLSDRVKDDRLVALEGLQIENGKTKLLVDVLKKLPSKDKKILLVVESKNMEVRRAAKNIPFVTTISPNSMNVLDLLRYPYIVAPKAEIETITKVYSV